MKEIALNYLEDLIKKYSTELSDLSIKIKKKYYEIRKLGFGATFSDFEGELLYCLIRDRKPGIIYEISPNCGYSSIYITSALSKNKKGKVFSFEIEKIKNNVPIHKVIESNLLKTEDFKTLQLVIGDASKTTSRFPDPDILLIDSCHDKWFGKWYTNNLLKRVKDLSIIQDILFFDRREYSGEAEYLISNYLNKNKYVSLGILERLDSFKRKRKKFVQRRPWQTNSILISKNLGFSMKSDLRDPLENNMFKFPVTDEKLAYIENTLLEVPIRQNKHRSYILLYLNSKNSFQKKDYFNNALAAALCQEVNSQVALVEIGFTLLKNKEIFMFLKFIFFRPLLLKKIITMFFIQARAKIRRKLSS